MKDRIDWLEKIFWRLDGRGRVEDSVNAALDRTQRRNNLNFKRDIFSTVFTCQLSNIMK